MGDSDTMMARNTKTHRCHRCCRNFARLEHLQRHERSHTKEKPFNCALCTKSFSRKDLLTRHDRLTHQEQTINVQTTQVVMMMSPSPTRYSTTAASASTAGNGSVPADEPLPPQSTSLPGSGVGMPDSAAPIDPDHFPIQNLDLSMEDFTHDFTAFMDSVPIPNHIFSPTFQPLPVIFSEDGLSPSFEILQSEAQLERHARLRVDPQASDPGCNILSTYGSRLPSLEPRGEHAQMPSRAQYHGPKDHLFVSVQGRERILGQLSLFPSCVPIGFALPSRYALSRFVAAYFNVFHEHYPFLHVPTFELETVRVELLLAIAAVGTRYSRDWEVGVELFHLAKAITLEGLHRRRTAALTHRNGLAQVREPESRNRYDLVEVIQALLLLMAIATWFNEEPAVYEALSIRSVVDSLIREVELKDRRKSSPPNWRDWVKYESLKRTKLVIFCFFNIHTIVFDMPPMMLSGELYSDLPCSENEWKAASETLWRESSDLLAPPQDFQAAFEQLFIPTGHESYSMASGGFSSLGGFVLIHAVIQRIWLVRNATLPYQQCQQLSLERMNSFERALKAWSICWESNYESSMDPLNPNGPLSFTSTALLRLAYIRINMDLGPVRSLGTWDPDLIAKSLNDSPQAQRSPKLTRAALHCAHALSIPVKMGIEYVARTQVIYWSNQHALCSLECAVLLAKWLEAVSAPNPSPSLDAAEEHTLSFVMQLVAESNYRGSLERMSAQMTVLSSEVVGLWATLYKSESVWQMVDLIHRSLNAFAKLLENRHRDPGSPSSL
ncbi:C2H2 transcription factor [Ilyonectria destructans]|nr:C2H2 transcription factor [Ilyonectria destructans]